MLSIFLELTGVATWTEYSGSDEQIDEIKNNTNGYIVRNTSRESAFILADRIRYDFELSGVSSVGFEYWLIPNDPLRKMKVRQAMTGQPVWVKVPYIPATRTGMYDLHTDNKFCYYHTTTPDWNIPNTEYSFTPFED